jgi:hypothetical protein
MVWWSNKMRNKYITSFVQIWLSIKLLELVNIAKLVFQEIYTCNWHSAIPSTERPESRNTLALQELNPWQAWTSTQTEQSIHSRAIMDASISQILQPTFVRYGGPTTVKKIYRTCEKYFLNSTFMSARRMSHPQFWKVRPLWGGPACQIRRTLNSESKTTTT